MKSLLVILVGLTFCGVAVADDCGQVNGRMLFSISSWEDIPHELNVTYREMTGAVLLFLTGGEVLMVDGVFHVELDSGEISFCYNCGYSVWRAVFPGDHPSCLVPLVFQDVKLRMTADGELRHRQQELTCDTSGGALVTCGSRVFLDTHIVNIGDMLNLFCRYSTAGTQSRKTSASRSDEPDDLSGPAEK